MKDLETENENNYHISNRAIKQTEIVITFKYILEESTWQNELNEVMTFFSDDSLTKLSFQGDDNFLYGDYLNSNDIFTPKYIIQSNMHNTYIRKNIIRNYMSWIKKQLNELKQFMNISFNFSYYISLKKMLLITDNHTFSQSYALSKSVITNSHTFIPFVTLENFFLHDNISYHVKDYFLEMSHKIPSKCLEIIFKYNVISQIIKKYILNFYADNIYFKNSLFNKTDIGKQILPAKITISTLPYYGIIFDGEGVLTQKKIVINFGKLVNIISNNKYSKLLDLPSLGNADLIDNNNVDPQRLQLDISETACVKNRDIITINNIFQISYNLNLNEITAQIIYRENSNNYTCGINIEINKLFQNMQKIGGMHWSNNVFCSNVYLNNCDGINFFI